MNGNEPTLEEAREIFNKDQFATKAAGAASWKHAAAMLFARCRFMISTATPWEASWAAPSSPLPTSP